MEDNKNAAYGIVDILIDSINKKYDDIRDLNSLKVNLDEENFEAMIPVIDSIVEDENNHIGKLQQLVDLLSDSENFIEEGKQETIEIIDNSDEFVESITSMKKKLILSENFDNVIDDVQAVADPVFVGANEEHDENKKRYEDAIEEHKKEAEETIPKEGDTGEKVKSKALKQMHLSEKLFEDTSMSIKDKIEDYIIDLIENEVTDNLAIRIASDIDEYDPSWTITSIGESPELEKRVDIAAIKYARALADLLLAKKQSMNEDLSFDDYSDFNSDMYNAITDVCYKYDSHNLSRKDIEAALEWFIEHFFEQVGDDEFEDFKEIEIDDEVVEESLSESIEEDVDKVISILDKIKETGSQDDSWIDELYSLFDKYGRDEVKLVFNKRRNITESIQCSIAKEQIKRFTEGKMPKNWNVDSYLTKLTEKKHISENEAKSLREWYSTIK